LNDPRIVIRKESGSAVPSHFGLPPELLAKARQRIAGLAGVLGALALIALVLNATVYSNQVYSAVQAQHWLMIGLALIVILTARSSRVSDSAALSIGLVYEVCLCWIISFASQRADVAMTGRPPEITWTSMVILVFPMVVPLPPRRLLVASVLGASSSPVTLLVLDRMGEYTATSGSLVGASISPAFASVLAYFGARMIHSIGLDVSKARLLGAYRLESRLGAGGMGEVWRASHRMLVRPAAIKLIAPHHLGSDAQAVLTRFEQEVQATAQLRSPHTVEVYDFGRADDGSFYYVMELLEGMDLQQLVDTHGPLPAARAVNILRQACHSLGEAHSAGLVHRDVKPANIFVCRYAGDFDFVKVLDFGLVKQQKLDGDPAVTRADRLLGTPAFMAPEMALGSEVDGRADIYALGCVAYWLLTGSLVFEGENLVATVAKHISEQPVPPSQRADQEIPAALERVIMDCLRKKPDDRPSSTEELASRLAGCDVDAWTPADAKSWWQRNSVEGDDSPGTDDVAPSVP
jgi:serine/threonine protein kinase